MIWMRGGDVEEGRIHDLFAGRRGDLETGVWEQQGSKRRVPETMARGRQALTEWVLHGRCCREITTEIEGRLRRT